MTDDILPELQHIKSLIEALPRKGGGEIASVVVAQLYGQIIDEPNDFKAFFSLCNSIEGLRNLIEIRFPERGRKAAALSVVSQLQELFSPAAIGRPYNEFVQILRPMSDRIIDVFPLLEDIEFRSADLSAHKADIFEEIEKARDRLSSNADLSDGGRKFINAQFLLLEKALSRFEKDGVGSFSASVYSTIGRIYIELKNEDTSKAGVGEVLDTVLKIHGLLQVGGDILKLSGPFISGLLEGPVG